MVRFKTCACGSAIKPEAPDTCYPCREKRVIAAARAVCAGVDWVSGDEHMTELHLALAELDPVVAKGQVWRFTDGSRWKVEDIHTTTVGLRRLPESGNPDVGYLEWHKDMREHVLEEP